MTRHLFAIRILFLLVVAGCASPAVTGLPKEEVARYRQQFLLSAMPEEEAQTVVEYRDAIPLSASVASDQEVTLTGVVGGMPNPFGDEQPDFPWRAGEAVFFLVDPTTAAQFDDHQHAEGEECSFCAGKARSLVNTVAMVVLQDASGAPIPLRADQLLGLKEGQTVTIRGKASLVGELLIVDAKQIGIARGGTTHP